MEDEEGRGRSVIAAVEGPRRPAGRSVGGGAVGSGSGARRGLPGAPMSSLWASARGSPLAPARCGSPPLYQCGRGGTSRSYTPSTPRRGYPTIVERRGAGPWGASLLRGGHPRGPVFGQCWLLLVYI